MVERTQVQTNQTNKIKINKQTKNKQTNKQNNNNNSWSKAMQLLRMGDWEPMKLEDSKSILASRCGGREDR